VDYGAKVELKQEFPFHCHLINAADLFIHLLPTLCTFGSLELR
jgi:hypothetical protein